MASNVFMSNVEDLVGRIPQWHDFAACASADPEEWFPERGEPAALAKRICNRCPVREECLEYALAAGEKYGIWGGTTERERRRLVRRAA